MTKKKRPSDYQPEPSVPRDQLHRYQLVMEVLSGHLTMAEGARHAGLSRNRFQTLVHRAQQGLIDGLSPKPAGRPAKSSRQAELEAKLAKLERDNTRLSNRVETIDRLLGVASEMLKGRIEPTKRRAKKQRAKRQSVTAKDEDPDPASAKLEAYDAMCEMGLRAPLAAAVVGNGVSTLRRWCLRRRRSKPLRTRTPHRRATPMPVSTRAEVERVVRELNGLVGAESLRRTVLGVSRRQAAQIKRQVLTEMERERKARTMRVEVTHPDVMRGFDAMYVEPDGERRFVLASGDASVPYRTQLALTTRYDEPAVLAALEQDLVENGAPLVYRLDRAKAHQTAAVRDLLREHGVLWLHGPPRHPGYYGQLERQNREHRAWLDALGEVEDADLDAQLRRMRSALNDTWRRRTLGFRTAGQAWRERPRVHIDRGKLSDSVHQRAERLRDTEAFRDASESVVQRFAIEQELTHHGFLSRHPGGWC